MYWTHFYLPFISIKEWVHGPCISCIVNWAQGQGSCFSFKRLGLITSVISLMSHKMGIGGKIPITKLLNYLGHYNYEAHT